VTEVVIVDSFREKDKVSVIRNRPVNDLYFFKIVSHSDRAAVPVPRERA
jgi:hypothetical protein